MILSQIKLILEDLYEKLSIELSEIDQYLKSLLYKVYILMGIKLIFNTQI